MEDIYNKKMSALGYNQLICDIFVNWEDVKDELLIPDRKSGSGNGTVHVFLGAADEVFQKEFSEYYASVKNGAKPEEGAISITHYFLPSNIISMLGYVCQYYYEKGESPETHIQGVLNGLHNYSIENGLYSTKSLMKLSLGSNKLRPYFKQFESNGVFSKIIRPILLPNSAYKISLYKDENGNYAAFWLIGSDSLSNFEADSSTDYTKETKCQIETINKSLQQIYYGAPGTGKSHTINDTTKDEDVLRTTFHPDTDYASFVGAYKPTTIDEQVMAVIGTQAVPVTNKDGSPRTESKIVYEFVAQSFLNAYIKAWEKQANTADGEVKKQYLVIEEINRGNCAQIFGDLFQLLDRNEYGFSEYPITADADMKRQLQKAFNGLEVTDKGSINKDFEGRDVVSEVLNGEILLLPNNFYIWATMNTSDQSLFPIDSAFKRRWDWQYMPISNGNKGWMIEAGGKKYDWWQFLSAINAKIGSTTSSEDKKLGYYFCKANGEGVITTDRFVGKVVFYIWNDVFKDYEFGDAIFNDPEGGKLTFDKFYTSEGKDSKVVEDNVVAFLSNLGVKPMEDGGAESLSDEAIADNIVIKVNGQQVDKYNAIGYTAVEKYVDMNPDKTAEEIANIWSKFVSCNPTKWFIVDETGRNELSERYANYSYEIKCADNKSVWVNKDGWRRATVNNSRDTVKELIDAVNAEYLGVQIEEIKQ